jgi:phenylalanyl-tRNA synthetase beta chain
MGFEVFLDNIPTSKKKGTAKANLTLAPFQPLNRDFAFIVDENIDVENITRAAKGADRNLITDVSIFDIYQGKGVDEGKKSIVDAVLTKTGAVLRG